MAGWSALRTFLVASWLLATTQAYSQITLRAADTLLTESGYPQTGRLILFTSESSIGTFLSIQTFRNHETDSYLTFHVSPNGLRLVPVLTNYRVFAYSKERDLLIVGFWDKDSPTDSGIETIYTYFLNSKTFVKQGTYAGGVYGLQSRGDTIFVRLNVKHRDGVGSELLYVPFPIH
jgi:hypothetical protein